MRGGEGGEDEGGGGDFWTNGSCGRWGGGWGGGGELGEMGGEGWKELLAILRVNFRKEQPEQTCVIVV